MHNNVKAYWDECSDAWFRDGEEALRVVLEEPVKAFPARVRDMLGNVKDKRVCVPSSGDNLAVFAFRLLGAHVTSVDISDRQMENARLVAKKYGWADDIRFVVNDSMCMTDIGSDEYDMVYTSNGVHVWIDDLTSMYREFHRVLKPGGRYVMFDTHPMVRPFDDRGETLVVQKTYDDIGPFGEVKTYDWRVQDYINALTGAGLSIRHMEEFSTGPDALPGAFNYFYRTRAEAEADGYARCDWRRHPWAAMPQCMSLRADKQ